MRRFVWFLISFWAALTLTFALPASLVEDVAANDPKDKKVKRTHGEIAPHVEEKSNFHPSAIKRGGGQNFPDWDERDKETNLADLASALYATSVGGGGLYDGKSIYDYEKGYRYGSNKDNLDTALENAVLKSELYEPNGGGYNQYRYFDQTPLDRKRRALRKIGTVGRNKRDLNLTPEEILTLLALWENEKRPSNNYHPIWSLYDTNNELEDDGNINTEENWFDTPVYPHANKVDDYLKPTQNYYEDKRGQWGGFSDYNRKRFMVAKKNDPTRELRYLNGPPAQKNEFYTLSQLLANQRDVDVPLYHRLVL